MKGNFESLIGFCQEIYSSIEIILQKLETLKDDQICLSFVLQVIN